MEESLATRVDSIIARLDDKGDGRATLQDNGKVLLEAELIETGYQRLESSSRGKDLYTRLEDNTIDVVLLDPKREMICYINLDSLNALEEFRGDYINAIKFREKYSNSRDAGYTLGILFGVVGIGISLLMKNVIPAMIGCAGGVGIAAYIENDIKKGIENSFHEFETKYSDRLQINAQAIETALTGRY